MFPQSRGLLNFPPPDWHLPLPSRGQQDWVQHQQGLQGSLHRVQVRMEKMDYKEKVTFKHPDIFSGQTTPVSLASRRSGWKEEHHQWHQPGHDCSQPCQKSELSPWAEKVVSFCRQCNHPLNVACYNKFLQSSLKYLIMLQREARAVVEALGTLSWPWKTWLGGIWPWKKDIVRTWPWNLEETHHAFGPAGWSVQAGIIGSTSTGVSIISMNWVYKWVFPKI